MRHLKQTSPFLALLVFFATTPAFAAETLRELGPGEATTISDGKHDRVTVVCSSEMDPEIRELIILRNAANSAKTLFPDLNAARVGDRLVRCNATTPSPNLQAKVVCSYKENPSDWTSKRHVEVLALESKDVQIFQSDSPHVSLNAVGKARVRQVCDSKGYKYEGTWTPRLGEKSVEVRGHVID